jgi:hypothetical protein
MPREKKNKTQKDLGRDAGAMQQPRDQVIPEVRRNTDLKRRGGWVSDCVQSTATCHGKTIDEKEYCTCKARSTRCGDRPSRTSLIQGGARPEGPVRARARGRAAGRF